MKSVIYTIKSCKFFTPDEVGNTIKSCGPRRVMYLGLQRWKRR